MLRTLLLGLAATASAQTLDDLYTITPVGKILSHCVHEVNEGAHSVEQPDGSLHVYDSVGHADRTDAPTKIVPVCDTRDPRRGFEGQVLPVLRRDKRGAKHVAGAATKGTFAAEGGAEVEVEVKAGGLPADYDGWLQYTAVNASKLGLQGGFDSFTNTMSVPDVPKKRAQVLYFFPGLQNIDWIPKVDPEPTESNPFDIIQPVLQYPGGVFSSGWELKSWYVTVNAGALYSSGITGIKAGEEILCNMTRTGPTSWIVTGALKSKPTQLTVQTATNARLKLQPWAYNTLECYGCSGCGTYPTTPITFTDNKLYQGGKLITVPGAMWGVNLKPAAKLECKEATTVAANGDTTISFV